MQVYLDGLLINTYLVWNFFIKCVFNDLINDFTIYGIQSATFSDIIFKFVTSVVRKFCKVHILFFIISIKFVSHQVHIYEVSRYRLRGMALLFNLL